MSFSLFRDDAFSTLLIVMSQAHRDQAHPTAPLSPSPPKSPAQRVHVKRPPRLPADASVFVSNLLNVFQFVSHNGDTQN